MANLKFDKIEKNMPIKYNEINNFWIYEGSNELEFTPFSGRYLNRAGKGIFLDMVFLQKVVQINKSILSALEGNFEVYNPQKIYSEGDVVFYNNMFYISLDDNNNKNLSNTEMWYPFRMTLKNFYLQDQNTNEIYKIFVKDGSLDVEKVSNDS
jgi:hypothetical protein